MNQSDIGINRPRGADDIGMIEADPCSCETVSHEEPTVKRNAVFDAGAGGETYRYQILPCLIDRGDELLGEKCGVVELFVRPRA